MAQDTSLADLPPELQIEAQRIRRRQALADRLLQQSLQPLQSTMAGGRVIPINPMQGIAQMAGAYWGAQGQERGDQQSAALSQRYNAGLAGAIENYMKTKQGSGIQPDPQEVQQGADYGSPVPTAQGDPRGAVVQAMTSGYGPLRQIGSMELSAMLKKETEGIMHDKDWLGLATNFEPNSVIQAQLAAKKGHPNPATFLRPKPQIMQHGGNVGAVTSTGVTPVGEIGSAAIPNNWRELVGLGEEVKMGPAPGQYYVANNQGGGDDLMEAQFTGGKYTGSKKVDNAPRITQINSPGGEGAKAAARTSIDLLKGDLETHRNLARGAGQDIDVLMQVIPMFNEGIKTGSFTEMRNAIEKAAITAGVTSDNPQVSRTDAFIRTIAKRTVALLGTRALGAGTGISDADRKFMEKVAQGDDLDAQGFAKFFELAMDTNLKSIDNFNRQVEQFQNVEGVVPQFGSIYGQKLPRTPTGGLGIGTIAPEKFGGRREQ